jgi:hypothetical protein
MDSKHTMTEHQKYLIAVFELWNVDDSEIDIQTLCSELMCYYCGHLSEACLCGEY